MGVDAVVAACGGDCARAACLDVDGEVVVGVDGFAVVVRGGEGCTIAEDQVGRAVEPEPPADRDVGGDDVPVLRAVRAIRDVGVRASDDGVVGAYLPVAVRVDVGHEVRAERLARDVGGIDRALVDGCAVGKQLPGLDGNGAIVGIVAAGGDAVGGVRPAEDDGAAVNTVVVGACRGDAAAIDGEGAVG